MDNQPNISYCHCVVCGDEFISISSVNDNALTRAENRRLFSIFLRCVSFSIDEIDSSIVSELDSVVNCSNDGSLEFCTSCKSTLIEWDKLYECLHVVIPQKLNRIKCMFYAKILKNNVPDKSDAFGRKSIGDHDGVSEDQNLSLVQKIQQIKDQICRQFSPRITLNKIPDSDFRRGSKNFNNSFDEDEFDAFSETLEGDTNYGNENNNKRGRRTFSRPNTASKRIGPGKFLYLDKFVFFQKNNKFECAECSVVTTRRNTMLRHIRGKHMKDDDFIENAETKHDLRLSVDYETNDGGENKGGGKRFTRANTVSKPIGPGKFVFGDKYIYFQENNKFECAECSIVFKRRDHMVCHIRRKHMKGEGTKPVPDGSESEGRAASKNLVNGFDEDEFEAINEIEHENYTENSEPDDSSFSGEGEPNDEGENERGRKTFTHPNTASKLIGPGEFLYLDKYLFFQKNNKFECAKCSALTTQRRGMLRHMRRKHMKDDDDFIEDAKTNEDRLSAEPNDGEESKRGRRTLRAANISAASKLVGPGKFLYLDKYLFSEKNNMFECAECSAVISERGRILRHIRQKHMKDQESSPRVTFKRIPSVNESEGRASENLVNDFDGDEFEAFNEIHNNDGDDDDSIENSKTMEDHASVDDGPEKKRKRKPFGLPNTVSKLIGPGKFLYRGKFVFFKKNNKYECGECPAVITQRGHMLRHMSLKHMKDGEQSRPKVSKGSVKADLTAEREKIVVVPLKVEGDHDLVTATAVFETERSNKFEEIDAISSATKEDPLVNNGQESETFSNEVRRNLRKRRPAANAVDLRNVDDEVSSDQEDGSAYAGHDDDWVITSESSGNDDHGVELNSVGSGDDEDEEVRKRPRLASTRGGKLHTKRNTKDVKRYDLVSSGPNEWIYADNYKIIFNSEDERYYCGLCSAVHSERAELVAHITEEHIDGKFTKKAALRQTAPDEYIYRDKYKVTVDKNDDWHCGECGAQRKNRVNLMTHIRESHIDPRKRPKKFRTFEEVSPNEFLYNGKYSFRFDPNQELYLCSLCEYTSAGSMGVLTHIRFSHYTDAEKQELRAVEVAPGEYLYGGRFKIFLENGRFRCALCSRTRDTLRLLYPHFRVAHPDGSGEGAELHRNQSLPREENDGAEQNPSAHDTTKTTAHNKDAKKERIRQMEERRSLTRAIHRGWKIQGNGKWMYKNNWQVMEENGKYKCLACDMQEGDRKTTFNHVQGVHAQEKGLVKPAVPVRRDEITELEYKGIKYKYDPFEEKYTCSLCHTKNAERLKMNGHIRNKHIDPQKFICDICGQEYDSGLSFRYHRARHEGPKYACKHCDKRFTADCYLRTHLKIHMGEDAKKHQCEFCGKKFYTPKELRNHRSSHTGEKPFPCDLCGESFPTTFKRREHRKKFHGGLPQKHGWKPTEGDMVRPVDSTREDLTVAEVETDTITFDSLIATTDGALMEPT